MSGIDPITVYHFDQDKFDVHAELVYPDSVLNEMARRVGDKLDEEILARLGYVRLPQRKVYLVHSESGEYSDWTFVPLAVFTTREKAVEWIEGKRFPITNDEYYGGLTTVVWDGDEVECHARPTTTYGRTWLVHTTEDGRKVKRSYDYDTWFIDELDLDPTMEETE